MATPSSSAAAATGIHVTPATLARRSSRRPTGKQRRETLTAYLFLIPYLIVLGVFTVFATFYVFGLSLFKLDIGFTAPQFVGIQSYQLLFQQLSAPFDSDFWTLMVNILKFTVVVVIGETVLALFMAVLLQNIPAIKSRGIF